MVKISGKTLMSGFYIRRAPSGGFSLAAKPGKYPTTSQQKKVRDIAIECGIKKGISKSELQDGMACVRAKWSK